jgi:hypothetical protein
MAERRPGRVVITPGAAFSFRSLWLASERAARGHKRNAAVASFMLERERLIVELMDELLAGAWRPRRTARLLVRDPKPRQITVPAFRDRVVHHAIAAVLQPRHERRLIADTYACRSGRGTHAAIRRGVAWTRGHRFWVRLDVERFFPSIDHDVVRRQLEQDVGEPWLRELCGVILAEGGGESVRRHVAGDDLFAPFVRRTGLPLGNLTSQLWANRYLDPVDHLVKERLRFRAYLRYMDDILLFHDDRARLEEVASAIEAAMHGLRLRLHRWAVHPTAAGVPLFGYRASREGVRVKRSSVARAERRLQARLIAWQAGELDREGFEASLRAVFGHWGHADTWRLRERTLRRLGILAFDELEE